MSALARAAPLLRCPHCAGAMALEGSAVRCAQGHSFDVARDGHVSLLAGTRGPRGDSAAMVAARAEFLQRGHFDPIVAELVAAARELLAPDAPAHVADVGAGTGFQLAGLLNGIGREDGLGIALDSSTAAARRAARSHTQVASVVCDAWTRLPLTDGAAQLLLNVFAPRGGEEMARVLDPRGTLLVVVPTPEHLQQLVRPFGLLSVDADKPARLAARLEPWLRRRHERTLRYEMSLDREEVALAVGMGPSARHLTPAQIAAATRRLPEPIAVTVSVTVAEYARTV